MKCLKFLKPFLICAVSLVCMAVSCPHYFDPFEEETNEGRGVLGFYADDSEVIYREAYITPVGEDSLEIYSTFWLENYGELRIKFAKKDMSLDTPITNPEISLEYVYSLTPYDSGASGNLTYRAEYRTIEVEAGELSFRRIGSSDEIYRGDVVSGNFSFEGTKVMNNGETREFKATDGTFDLRRK